MKKQKLIRPILGAAMLCTVAAFAPVARAQTAPPATKPTPAPLPIAPPNKGYTMLLTTDAQVPIPSLFALRGSLKADKKTLKVGESITFTYSVTNTSKTNPLLVNFSSGQRFDLLITRSGGGAPVWQFSKGRMFTMALGMVTFAPGETKTFTATYKPTTNEIKPGGSYVATIYLIPLIKEKTNYDGIDNTLYAHANLSLTAAK